jgi:lipopolysaccharide biosynthesis protein
MAYRAVSNVKSKAKGANLTNLIEQRRITRQFNSIAETLRGIVRAKDTKTAVVVHLYYTDSWEQIQSLLKNLRYPYDLFLTLPYQNIEFGKVILTSFPKSYIFETPNQGRDVLPFLQIAQGLEGLGYEYVLKIHSKKSPHRKDGDKWFNRILSSLLPDDKKIMDELMDILRDKDTGIVGPKSQYISLIVNFSANGPRIAEALSNIYSPKTTDQLIRNRRQHGFFAGTMFWARLDAIRPILDRKFKVNRFDPEKGQIDATFAHALERVFCLVPQIDKRNMYEIGPGSVKQINYKTTNVPNWSSVYIGPKPDKKNRHKN